MADTNKNIDIVIIGAGIAGLWAFHRLKTLGYDAVSYTHLTLPTTPYV